MLASIFETIMLLCFGCAWPMAIHKSYTSRSCKGKSIYFLYAILLGYICGIIFQYLIMPFNYVMILFLINASMVFIDIILYYRNRFLEKK